MAKGIEVDVDGVDDIDRRLTKTAVLMRDLSTPLKGVARTLRRRAARQFQTQGRAFGTPWPSLSPKTIRARMRGWGYYRSGGAGRMLSASGGLRRSFTSRAHTDHVSDIRRQSMRWGSKHNLAHLHAQGPQSRGPAGPLPKREIIAFRSDEERDELFREPIAEHVMQEFGVRSRSRLLEGVPT